MTQRQGSKRIINCVPVSTPKRGCESLMNARNKISLFAKDKSKKLLNNYIF